MENQNNTTFNSDFCEYPVIKAVNGEDAFPPTNSLETNVGDMIIGTNDFTIETYIKFDDVNQDHRIINHVETSRNRSTWLLYHRGDRTESSGGSFGDTEGRWFQWLVNNGNGPTSASNIWVNHISFLSPIPLENDIWYHIALVRKNVTNWAFYVNGQKHQDINITNMRDGRHNQGLGSYAGSIPSFSGPTYIGYNYHSTSGDYYMQSFRVTNVAMYANEFTPHTTPHIEEVACLKRCEYKLQYKLVLPGSPDNGKLVTRTDIGPINSLEIKYPSFVRSSTPNPENWDIIDITLTDESGNNINVELKDKEIKTATLSSGLSGWDLGATIVLSEIPVDCNIDAGSGLNPDGDGGVELEFRWADGLYQDEKILQVKNLKQPTHTDGNFEDRDMSAWSTVYAREDNEDQFDLSHAFWPDAAVDESYSFSKNITFDGITFELDNSDTLPTGQTTNNGYLQLYANFENANADLEPSQTDTSSRKALFVYFGDNADSENSASGRVGASLVTYLPSTTTTGESTADTNIIPIDPSIQSSFKVGQTIILSEGTNIEETHEIAGFGSLKTVEPIQNTHPVGSTITTPSASTFVDPTDVPTTNTPTDFCDCSNCDDYASGTTSPQGAIVKGSDGNYYECNDQNGCTDDPTDDNSDQFNQIDATAGCPECCPTPSPYINPCAGLGNQDCPNQPNANFVTSVAPYAYPDASGNCYPSCNQCDNDADPIPCNPADGVEAGDRYRLLNNPIAGAQPCDFGPCECDEARKNCADDNLPGGDPKFKSKSVKRKVLSATGLSCDYEPCPCNDEVPVAGANQWYDDAVTMCEAGCGGPPVRDPVTCDWVCGDIGCLGTIAGNSGDSKKDCMEQNAEDCPDGAKTDKQEVKADCSGYKDCECKDVPEQAGNPSDEEKCPNFEIREQTGNVTLRERDANNDCEFSDCPDCTPVTEPCPGDPNKERTLNADCTWGDCECTAQALINAQNNRPICFGNTHSVLNPVTCEYGPCECDWDDIPQPQIPCFPGQTYQKDEDNCEWVCWCDPQPGEVFPAIGDDMTRNFECDNGQIQQTFNANTCTWEPPCDDPIACAPGTHLEYFDDSGNPCTSGIATASIASFAISTDSSGSCHEVCVPDDTTSPTDPVPTDTTSPSHSTTDYVTIPEGPGQPPVPSPTTTISPTDPVPTDTTSPTDPVPTDTTSPTD